MTFEIRIADSDVQFTAQASQTVLDAALKAGIELPYSCRKGVCGTCAGGVLSGQVQGPTRTEATPEGQHLLCVCSPQSDLQIAPTRWRRIDPTARRRFQVKVFRNTLVAPDVSLLVLRLPAGQRARFKAGQYVQVGLPDGSQRAYSLANAPHESDTLQLHVRHVPGGQFSQIVTTMEPGAMLEVALPFGQFELREASTAPMLCVVGGTGFAPVKSLLDHMHKRGLRRAVTLVWGARDRHGLYLPAAVKRWQQAWPDFRYVPAIEDAADAQALAAFHGRVDAAVHSLYTAGASALIDYEVYCCGAPAMVAATRKACVESLGLDARNFLSDSFVPGPAHMDVAPA